MLKHLVNLLLLENTTLDNMCNELSQSFFRGFTMRVARTFLHLFEILNNWFDNLYRPTANRTTFVMFYSKRKSIDGNQTSRLAAFRKRPCRIFYGNSSYRSA